MNVTTKNIPEAVLDGLRKEASRRGKSLNEYLLTILTDANEEQERRQFMLDNLHKLSEFRKKLPPMPPLQDILDDERHEREGRLG